MRSTALVLTLLLFSPACMAAPRKPDTAASDWVARSNQDAQVLLQAQSEFAPERASSIGLPGYDDKVSDLGPHYAERRRAAYAAARDKLQLAMARETDPNVRQDLQIMIDAANRSIEGSELEERMMLDWIDAPELVFGGEQSLLQQQASPEKRAKALIRLQRYLGLVPGSTSIFEQAKSRFADSIGGGRIGPYKNEVEHALANATTYADGIRKMFVEFGIAHADTTLAALDKQVADYAAWESANVLPKARADFRLPPELYAFGLKRVGIDIDPMLLIQRASLEYMETRAEMQQLAPIVAREHGFDATDYRDVIRALKKDQLDRTQVEPYYRDTVIPAIEKAIAANHIVSLPQRPMIMRIASDAETAAQPAPHMQPPPLIDNHGERGQFVLSTGDPSAGPDAAYDDFDFKAAAWTISAHEARPGHELQFAQMLARGVSQARALYAFNSVNAEGWALYAESQFMPYEPIEGQLIAMQYLLLRESRAMLDPMLNLGQIEPDQATRWLREQVGLSKAFTKEEVDRFTYRGPGQAGSYYYGYGQLADLRTATELALGDKFDRKAFNDFIVDQGLLPLDLLGKAVREQFIPVQMRK